MNALRQLSLCAIIIFITGVIGFYIYKSKPEPTAKEPEVVLPVVEYVLAEPAQTTLQVPGMGTVTASRDTMLATEVSGRVLKTAKAFDSGHFIQKGDKLLELDDLDYKAAVANAEAALAMALADLKVEEAAAAQAEADWERLKTESKGLVQQEPSELLLRQPQLLRAQTSVRSAKLALEQAEDNLEQTIIRAPYDGLVVETMVDEGDYLPNAGVAVARIIATDYAEVRIPLSDTEFSRIGDARGSVLLSGKVDGTPTEWAGQLDRVEATVDPMTRQSHVVVRYNDPYHLYLDTTVKPLKIGTFVDVLIEGKTYEQAYTLPRTALTDDKHVYVIDAEDKLYTREVQVVSSSPEIIVVNAGLEPGERVCVTPMEFVVQGMKVKVLEAK